MSGKFVGVEFGRRMEFQVFPLLHDMPVSFMAVSSIMFLKYAEVPSGKIIYHVADQKTII